MLSGYEDCQFETDCDFSGLKTDIKPIVFYLPQFHTIPENDRWWGTGFTEWTSTRKAKPLFQGHYMPRTPHKSIGYYDLSDYHVLEKQAELAAKHGVFGFCFYYYWFSGKRLLEKPVDILLQHPKIQLNFCLCWANENWTRTWDGLEKSILIKQRYTENDPKDFILDLKKYLDDPRYIRIDGKPLVLVYAPKSIPQPKEVFQVWRETAQESGIGDFFLAVCRTFGENARGLGILDAVDAEVEFPPHNVDLSTYRDVVETLKGSGHLMSYSTAANKWKYDYSVKPVFRTVMLNWDNTARRADGWCSYADFTLRDFRQWIRKAIRDLRINLPTDRRFLFVNAWNEWGEGTYLEPDEKYGYMNINALSRAIFNLHITTQSQSDIQDFPSDL